jgi:uroporphyrinogen decarboxylase
MNAKERVIATLRREPVDRTPLDCWLYHQYFLDKLEPVYGRREQFMDEFNIDLFTGFMAFPSVGLNGRLDVDDLAEFKLDSPRDPKWLTHTAWTDDFAGVNILEAVEQQGGRRAIVAHLWGIVEGTSMLIGIENCWLNMAENKKLMLAWFDRYTDWLCGLVDVIADTGVDIITLSDDWGSNKTMIFSPRMWRKMIAPYTRRVVEFARQRGLYVNLHSDGYIMPVMDDIVDIGYNSLHPVQESAGMDPATVKREYGDKIVVYGSLDVIDGILAYEGDALAAYITERFDIYAPGGGFIFNSGHFIQPDIPPERLIQTYTLANRLAQKYGAKPTD